ncbi:hypothetical protein CVT26_007532 [Gymnopilus dilepis]|uniref:Uncharacterized protein n=1 Tax=Gymnopilus dilepis TaxID=231916 RepID=A0A409W880_9AGAR|nr:hypothetical protein CVT26_007532 [Gymnopilus dilepis]
MFPDDVELLRMPSRAANCQIRDVELQISPPRRRVPAPSHRDQENLAAPLTFFLPAPQRSVGMVGVRVLPPPPPFLIPRRTGEVPMPEVRQPPHRAEPAVLLPPLPPPQQAGIRPVLLTVLPQVRQPVQQADPVMPPAYIPHPLMPPIRS